VPGPSEGNVCEMRVVIADDHALYREGLARLLRQSDIEVVGEAPDGETAVEVVTETSPDVVLLDLRMPGTSGMQAMQLLSDQAAPSRVVVLSVSADESDVADAISAGASGYVLKDEPVQEVIAGINAAVSGGARISPRVALALLNRVQGAIEAGEDLAGGGLSTTELQLLNLIAAGKRDREVSERLSIGEEKVGDYIRSILTKLHVESRVRDARRGEQV
jgi:DNA-binding NarL/FixJ family response regulator